MDNEGEAGERESPLDGDIEYGSELSSDSYYEENRSEEEFDEDEYDDEDEVEIYVGRDPNIIDRSSVNEYGRGA